MGTSESRLIAAAQELVAHEVLVVDADPSIHKGIVQLLAPVGIHVTATTSDERALELVSAKFFGVVLLDLDTPSSGAGVALLEKIRGRSPVSKVFLLCARRSFDAAVQAFRLGAADVVAKAPDQVEYLKTRVVSAATDVGSGRGGSHVSSSEVRDILEQFLKAAMSAERRVIDLEDQIAGRDKTRSDLEEEVRILFVDADDRLFKIIAEKIAGKGYSCTLAATGGEALDKVTSSSFHIVLVGEQIIDLPATMVVKSLRAQAPNLIVIKYVVNGPLEIVETTKTIPIVDKFTAPAQLLEHLDELAQAHQAKGRERRYLQAFRDKHYELLRRLGEMRRKLDDGT